MSSISKSFVDNEVVPDIITSPPQQPLMVRYRTGVIVSEGNELTPTSVKDVPTVSWEADADSFYTLVMIDPDAPSRSDPSYREILHWLVVNIPGDDLAKGDTVADYIGSGPPEGTGLHRYIFLLFKHSERINFTEKKADKRTREGRIKVSTAEFIAKYSLGNPIAGNFYQAQYDDYVKILHKELKGE